MASGVASALRLGARYQRRYHGREAAWGIVVYQGVRPSGRGYCKRRRREAVNAEGTKLRWPRAKSHFRLGDLRSVLILSSPSGVWGGTPETNAILNISHPNGAHFGLFKISHFLTIK